MGTMGTPHEIPGASWLPLTCVRTAVGKLVNLGAGNEKGWKIPHFSTGKYIFNFKGSIFQLLLEGKTFWEKKLCSNYTLHFFDVILWMAKLMAGGPHTMAIHLVIPELSGCNRNTVQNFPH